MPPALLGSSAATGTAKTAGNGPRNDGPGGDRRDFDAMLNGDTNTAPKPSDPTASKPAKPAASGTPTPDADAAKPTDPGKRPASEDSGEPGSEVAATPATPAKPGEDTADDTDAAPWPPFGLAGLALIGLEPAAAPATPPPPAATGTATDPLLAAATAPPATAAAAPALSATGTAAATATAPAAAIVLPADAEVTDDSQLLKAVTDAIASNDAGDAPATPLLHALHAAAELKGAAVTAAFTGSPTATPDVGADDFGDAMSARIGWLADQKIGHAVIRVTPHDLGQVEVRLQIDGDKIHASFSSAHADVRHALETSLPRLREMLGEQGFQLGNADVGHQHTAQDGKAGGDSTGQGGGDGEPALADITVSPAQLMRQRGLVDAYA
jgi:flagellar hook-length control protein FliK